VLSRGAGAQAWALQVRQDPPSAFNFSRQGNLTSLPGVQALGTEASAWSKYMFFFFFLIDEF